MATMMNVDFQNSFFIFILLCLASLLFFSRLFKKPEQRSRTGCVLPPSPPSLPIIGHLHFFLSTLIHKSLLKVSSKYGPILYLRVFNSPILLVSSASVAYEIFKTQDVNVSSRTDTAKGDSLIMGSNGFVFAPYGDYWKFMKKIVATKLIGPQAIEKSREDRAEEMHKFYANLLDKATKKESVDIVEEVMKLTNSIIFKMSMGRSYSEENNEAERVRQLVIKCVSLLKNIMFSEMSPKLLEKLGISLFQKDIMRVSNEFDELLERLLVEHEKKLEEHKERDMMDLLFEAYEDEKAEYKITRNQIKSFLVDIFIAGSDTSVQVIHWILAELINKPHIVDKIREEIDSVVGKTRLIKETDLPSLPYLQMVVKEGLRMYPPGVILIRTFQESCEVNGFYIPKKTTLMVNTYALMRDPNSWEDPDEFKPERFLSRQEEEKDQGMMKFLTFGAGRRACPGSNLAYVVIEMTIGVMIQCFDWKNQGDNKKVDMEEAIAGMNLVKAHPLKCTPIVRVDPFILSRSYL